MTLIHAPKVTKIICPGSSWLLSVLLSTTAANPAIRCRCGICITREPSPQTLYGIFPPSPLSTTAAKSTFRCHCGSHFPYVPSPQAPVWHLSSVSPFHNGSKTHDSVPLRHLPAVCYETTSQSVLLWWLQLTVALMFMLVVLKQTHKRKLSACI